MPDRTHSITVTTLTVFYEKSCVLQYFIATGVSSFIPDDIIIATVTHFLMPDLTHIATVILLTLAVLGAIFTDSFWCIGVSFTDSPHILA